VSHKLTREEREALDATPRLQRDPFGWYFEGCARRYSHRARAISSRVDALAHRFGWSPGYSRWSAARARLAARDARGVPQ
jgi:hypothetical protein